MVNDIHIIGNLGADPEMRYTGSGKAVVNFSVAVSEKWNGGEHTEWFRVVMWERQAEIASEYLSKGSKVYIRGSIRTRTWDKDGVKQYTQELIGHKMQMLTPKSEGQAGGYPQPGNNQQAGSGYQQNRGGGNYQQTKQGNYNNQRNTVASNPNQAIIPDDDIPF